MLTGNHQDNKIFEGLGIAITVQTADGSDGKPRQSLCKET